MKSILDPSFRYTPSAGTDLRKTFARIRREQQKQDQTGRSGAEAKTNVLPITQRKLGSAGEPARVASDHP